MIQLTQLGRRKPSLLRRSFLRASLMEFLVMTYLVIGAVVALTFVRVFRIKRDRSTRHRYLSQSCPQLSVMGVQIICANCSGDELLPVKTYMDRRGACQTCGGKSYMLASKRGSELNQKRPDALPDIPAITRPSGQEPAKSGRLLAFRTTAAHRQAN
jgi:hypothetical protein